MRSIFLASVCALALALSAYLAGKPGDEGVKLRVRLVDADTGKDVTGIVRVFEKEKDEPLALPGLFDRLRGLKPAKGAGGWHVIPPKGGADHAAPHATARRGTVGAGDGPHESGDRPSRQAPFGSRDQAPLHLSPREGESRRR